MNMRLVMLMFALAACADKPTAPYPISEPPHLADAAVGPGDIFDVRVYGEPELTGTYQVAPDGTITFPLIGTVKVSERLPNQIELELSQRLADGYLKDPQVSILVKEYRSKKVSILGQVRSPGTFPYAENMSIVEAVSRAGGFTPLARKNNVKVTRRDADGRERIILVAVEDIGVGKAPNFLLRPGDVVYVPERTF